MPVTTIRNSIGSRSADAVTISSVSGSTPGPYTVTLNAAVPATTAIGDSLTMNDDSRKFLITGISGSDLTVIKGIFAAASDPAAGGATTQRAYAGPHLFAPTPSSFPSGANCTIAQAGLWGSDGGIWKGEHWNDAEFVIDASGEKIEAPATIMDATRYIELTCAPGESFLDQGAGLNHLRPDQANGVLIRVTSAAGTARMLLWQGRFSGIQFYDQRTAAQINEYIAYFGGEGVAPTYGGSLVNGNIFKGERAIEMRKGVFVNNAVIITGAAHAGIENPSSWDMRVTSNTFVNVSGSSSEKAIKSYGALIAKNNATFGWGADNAVAAGSTNGATDRANFADNSTTDQESLTTLDQIESITSGSEDLNVKSGSALESNGADETTYTNDLDILGLPRHATTPTIGCREYVVPAGQPGARRLGGIRFGRPGGMPGVNVFKRAFDYSRDRRIFLPSLRLEPAA